MKRVEANLFGELLAACIDALGALTVPMKDEDRERIVRSLRTVIVRGYAAIQPPQPEFDICSDCKEHAGFEWDEGSGAWISECCSASPYSPDDYEFNEER